MPKIETNLLSEKELREFLENLPNYGDIKWPSKHWNDVKYICFKDKDKQRTVLDSFEEGNKEYHGSEEQQQSKKHETGESEGKSRSCKTSEGNVVDGSRIHSLLDKYLTKRRQKKGQDDTDRELLQVEKVVKETETRFECSIVASEVKIQGFAINKEKQHYWKGKMDAVALDENGRVLIIDWATCGNVTEFWRVSQYSQKLHQCLIYRELVNAHLKEYFTDKKIDSGIMIVAIDCETINDFKPRLCVNFERLKKEEFFKIIDEFKWHGRKPCCCKSTCETKGEGCSSHCGYGKGKFQSKNGKSEAREIEHDSKTKEIEKFVGDLSQTKTKKLLTDLLCNGRLSLDYARNLTKDYDEDVSDRKDPLQQKLEQKVKTSGLQFRHNVPGDGNCMFHAVADQLKRLGQQDYDHVKLRNLAVAKLKEWKENLDCSEEYLEKMSKDGEWGTGKELKALAYALDIQIRVVVAYEDYPDFFFEAMKPQKGQEPILLGFDGNGHYYSLEPVVPGSLEEQLKQTKEDEEEQEQEDKEDDGADENHGGKEASSGQLTTTKEDEEEQEQEDKEDDGADENHEGKEAKVRKD